MRRLTLFKVSLNIIVKELKPTVDGGSLFQAEATHRIKKFLTAIVSTITLYRLPLVVIKNLTMSHFHSFTARRMQRKLSQNSSRILSVCLAVRPSACHKRTL